LHMLFWFVVLQIFLALMSGAAGPCSVDLEEFEELNDEEKEDVVRKKKVNMACYAVLLAHITGFAAINAFVTLQQLSWFAESWWRALLVVPIVLLVNLILQRVTDFVRETISGDDGDKDVFEELWDSECEESENDVMGLALSFTTVNALRFLITGCLPNQEGKEEGCGSEEFLYEHTMSEKVALVGLGLVFAFGVFVIRVAWPACLEPKAIKRLPEERQHLMSLVTRLWEGIYVALCMAFSWSFFYGAQMVIAGLPMFHGRVEILAVVIALVLSFVCIGGSIPLDKLADSECTGPKIDDAIRAIMSAMGLLIGFAWERAFDQSVADIAETTENSGIILVNEHSTRFLLTLFCASLLVPAWKWYILPYIVVMGWHYQFSQDGFKIEDLEGLAKTYIITDNSDEHDESEDWFRGEESEEEDSEEDKTQKKQNTVKRIQRVKKVLKATSDLADIAEQELMNGKKGGGCPPTAPSDSTDAPAPLQGINPMPQQAISPSAYTPLVAARSISADSSTPLQGIKPMPQQAINYSSYNALAPQSTSRPFVSNAPYGSKNANSSRTMHLVPMPTSKFSTKMPY